MPPQSTTDIVLPGSYVNLMKRVGHIRRPFLAQAITVVGLCRHLARKFGELKSATGVTTENFNSLEEYVLLLRAETNHI
jgi:hypothetical protein